MDYAGPAVFLVAFFALMLVAAIAEWIYQRRHDD